MIKAVEKWDPPTAGWQKFNVDETVNHDKAWSACIFQDHLGKPSGAWVLMHPFPFFFFYLLQQNWRPFCSLFKPEMISNLRSIYSMVMRLVDKAQEDWRSSPLVDVGSSFVSKWPWWSASFIPELYNYVAHNLA